MIYVIIRYMKNTQDRFWAKVDKSNPNGCWEWTGCLHQKGYGLFNWTDDGAGRLAHRFSAKYIGNMDINGLCVCHHCDNRKCINPSHLFVGTIMDNNKDMENKGRRGETGAKGSINGRAKLTEQQVLEIRALPGPHSKIAKYYNVSLFTIDNIRARKTWRHI